MFYINGSFVEGDAKISVLDLGLVRGYGVFDYLRTYNGKPFHMWEHLLRLKYSAELIGISLPNSLGEIQSIIETMLSKATGESSIKIILTGGISPDQFTPDEKPSLIVHLYPHKSFPSEFYSEGIKVTTTSHFRCLPTSKTLQYIPAIIALQDGRKKGAQEALYLNAKREILEATTSNFFAFKGDKLITSGSDDILFGITREIVLELAGEHFPIAIQPIHELELGEFDEAFVSSSNKEIMPVTQVDDQLIGTGKPGKRTLFLKDLFFQYADKGGWPRLNIPRYADF